MGASETPTAERYEVAILEKRLSRRGDLRNNGPAERDRQLPVSAAPRDPGRSDPERDPPLNSTLLSNHLLGLTNVQAPPRHTCYGPVRGGQRRREDESLSARAPERPGQGARKRRRQALRPTPRLPTQAGRAVSEAYSANYAEQLALLGRRGTQAHPGGPSRFLNRVRKFLPRDLNVPFFSGSVIRIIVCRNRATGGSWGLAIP